MLQELRRCNTSGGELLLVYYNRGYIFYTTRRGLSEGYDGHEGSEYDYRAMDK
jgi:hypothetical protein